MNIDRGVKFALITWVVVIVSAFCIFWTHELYLWITTKTETIPTTEIPIGASLLKTYDTHGSYKLKLWKLDEMCFLSYDIESTSASLTYVPCPTQEKEKP